MARGEEALCDRLIQEAAEVTLHTRRLALAKYRRNLLIGKAKVAKWTVRTIAEYAGISNVRVSQVKADPSHNTKGASK